MRDVGLIVKVTRRCNLRCSYCYDWRSGPEHTMPFNVAARMTAAALRDPEHRGVEFLWHGGEPTLVPVEYFEKVMAVQGRLRRPGQSIINSIHTNATNISKKWVDFFRKYGWQVGISVDGPREIHDRHRVDVAGRPSLERALRGYETLRSEGLGVGVISVVDRRALDLGPEAVFDFMAEVGIRNYGINFAMPDPQPHAAPGTRVDHYITSEERNRFLIGLYDRWRAQGDPAIGIREISAIRQRLQNVVGGSLPCTLSGDCFGHLYTVEANGDVNHCCYLLGDPRYRWGNIMRQDFPAIRRSHGMTTIAAENTDEKATLQGCPEVGVCRGGCPMERYMSARHDPEPVSGCCGQAEFISHVRAHPFAQGNG
ncbi:radical SAM protein [Streptomyces nigrescens]